MTKQPKENMKLQLRELATNEVLKSNLNLNTLETISLSTPVANASVERSPLSDEVNKNSPTQPL